MATILQLKPTAASQRIERDKQHKTSAEIIFFPGVRYEHWKVAPKVEKTRRSRTRVKRDRLVIVV